MTKPIILASFNSGKAREMSRILAPVEVKSLRDLGIEIDLDSVETGNTYEENAVSKVKTVSALSISGDYMMIIADDSGLEVDALDGRPGIHSARYGGGLSDGDKCKLLLHELDEMADMARTARFVCVIAALRPDGEMTIIRESCEGVITGSPEGDSGFGYDPVFFFPPSGKTMAQMDMSEKNMVSHRGKALATLKKLISDTI